MRTSTGWMSVKACIPGSREPSPQIMKQKICPGYFKHAVGIHMRGERRRAPVSPHETSASKMSTWDDASPLIKRCVWSVRAEPLLLVSCCRRSIRLLLSSPSFRLKR
ncbi:unnamed protein product [Boreogadus saida]